MSTERRVRVVGAVVAALISLAVAVGAAGYMQAIQASVVGLIGLGPATILGWRLAPEAIRDEHRRRTVVLMAILSMVGGAVIVGVAVAVAGLVADSLDSTTYQGQLVRAPVLWLLRAVTYVSTIAVVAVLGAILFGPFVLVLTVPCSVTWLLIVRRIERNGLRMALHWKEGAPWSARRRSAALTAWLQAAQPVGLARRSGFWSGFRWELLCS